MKRIALLLLTSLMCVVSCEFDDSELWDTIKDTQERVNRLETMCEQINTSLSGLQALVQALQNNDYINSISPIKRGDEEIGYTISFVKSGAVTIYHGRDGKDGHIPEIGVKKDSDGFYYWIVEGKWLLDESNNKVRANGVDGLPGQDGEAGQAPELKIESGYWFVRYTGEDWQKLGPAQGADGENADCIFKDVIIASNEVTFVLTNGERLVLPLKNEAALEIDLVYTEEAIAPGHTTEINYKVYGTEKAIVSVIVQNGWEASVFSTSSTEGKILVTAPAPLTDGNITVLVSDGEQRTIMRAINFEDVVLKPLQNGVDLGSEAGMFNIAIETNINYTLVIRQSKEQWLWGSETRGTHINSHSFSYSRLESGKRWAYIDCVLEGKTLFSIKVNQNSGHSTMTVAEFIQNGNPDVFYQLEGKVEAIAKSNSFRGFDINDGTGTVTVAFPKNWDEWKDKIQEGGTVTVIGRYELYFHSDRKTHQVKDAIILDFLSSDAPVSDAIFSESFASSLGQFKAEDVTRPSELSGGVWQYSGKFKCAVATGYTGGKDGSELSSESSIVSPEIDLTSVKEAYISFEQAGNYFKDAKAATSLEISKNGADWTALAMDNSNLSSFTWKSFSLDITAYAGSKIKVRFHYKSTPENCGTWLVKNFSVIKGEYVAPEPPKEPDIPEGTKVVLRTNVVDMSFVPETDAAYGSGFAASKDGVKIGYYQHKSTSASVGAKDDHIRLYTNSAIVITLEKGGNFKYIKMLTTGGDKCVTYQAPKGEMVKVGDSVIWTGSAASPFVGEMVNGQIRLKELILVY